MMENTISMKERENSDKEDGNSSWTRTRGRVGWELEVVRGRRTKQGLVSVLIKELIYGSVLAATA